MIIIAYNVQYTLVGNVPQAMYAKLSVFQFTGHHWPGSKMLPSMKPGKSKVCSSELNLVVFVILYNLLHAIL